MDNWAIKLYPSCAVFLAAGKILQHFFVQFQSCGGFRPRPHSRRRRNQVQCGIKVLNQFTAFGVLPIFPTAVPQVINFALHITDITMDHTGGVLLPPAHRAFESRIPPGFPMRFPRVGNGAITRQRMAKRQPHGNIGVPQNAKI